MKESLLLRKEKEVMDRQYRKAFDSIFVPADSKVQPVRLGDERAWLTVDIAPPIVLVNQPSNHPFLLWRRLWYSFSLAKESAKKFPALWTSARGQRVESIYNPSEVNTKASRLASRPGSHETLQHKAKTKTKSKKQTQTFPQKKKSK